MLAKQNKVYAQILNDTVHWIFTSNELPEWNEEDIKVIDITNLSVGLGDKWNGKKFIKLDTTEINKAILIQQAKGLLAENDFRWSNQIRWNNYTDAERQALTTYYNALLAVVNGESNTLPTLEN